jgi:hypothetical protein
MVKRDPFSSRKLVLRLIRSYIYHFHMNECVEIWGNSVDWVSGPEKLFHKLVILSVDGSRIDSNQSSFVYFYNVGMNEWLHHVMKSCSIHLSCLLQQHKTVFIYLSTGLVILWWLVRCGQDDKLAREEQQQLQDSVALGSDKGEWGDVSWHKPDPERC